MTIETQKYPQLTVLPATKELISLFTIIRNKDTCRQDFIFYSDRIIRLLIEEALNLVDYHPLTVETPLGLQYKGFTPGGKICGVSIMRAGEAMEQGLRDCCRAIRIGKILIQRDEDTALPKMYYSKLPHDIAQRKVLLLDPMLATGGSAKKAIQVLLDSGVKESSIHFINLIAAPEGLESVLEAYPQIKLITGQIDEGLDAKKYIVPGLGDFGCRYFGTLDD